MNDNAQLRARLAELIASRDKAVGRRDKLSASISDLDRRINAIEIVLNEILKDDKTSGDSSENPRTLVDAVRRVVVDARGPFTVEDVRQVLSLRWDSTFAETDPESVGGAVNRLAREGFIQIQEHARGRRSAIYLPAERDTRPAENLLEDEP